MYRFGTTEATGEELKYNIPSNHMGWDSSDSKVTAYTLHNWGLIPDMDLSPHYKIQTNSDGSKGSFSVDKAAKI
jgi:hypothetical protein